MCVCVVLTRVVQVVKTVFHKRQESDEVSLVKCWVWGDVNSTQYLSCVDHLIDGRIYKYSHFSI